MELKLTNTLGRKKEVFSPLKNKTVNMYVCGVTPYDYSHIGHGRSYVCFDILVRLLKLLSYQIKYIRNITDIDDKLLNKAEKEFGDQKRYNQIAEKFTKLFQEDVNALNCLNPDIEPKVTDNIPEIISFIQGLIEKKHAYVLDNDVYFDIQSFPAYGKLSGKKVEDLIAGARVEIDTRKKDPADFVLWKGNDQNLFWESPWGYGRPGWHIECSVMANKFLGSTLDIHGGGMDLIFPHHENEIAQSESFNNKPLANFWIHNAFVNINKQKMSKSLGNFFTLRVIFEQFDPMVLRFHFLQHQYRTPLEFNLEDLKAAEVAYKKLVKIFQDVDVKKEYSFYDFYKYEIGYEFFKKMLDFLCDDLNTPGVLGILFENLDKIKESKELKILSKAFLIQILGLTLKPIQDEIKITPEIQKFIEQREQARKDKNWSLADQLRDKLKDLGYEVQDKKIK
jgi:cysteinyl-tRNA synthetase